MADKKNTAPRKRRTNEEIAAELEAKLAEVRNRGAVKDRKRHSVLDEQRVKLVTKIHDLSEKVEAIDDEMREIEARTPINQHETAE